MAHISLPFPNVPPKPGASADLLSALGRLVVAWSSAEFYLAMQMTQLMAIPDLSTPEKLKAAQEQGSADAIADTNGIFSIFFAIDSNRGRREIVTAVAKARRDENRISAEIYKGLTGLLEQQQKLAKRRNKFIHTAISQHESGDYIFFDEQMMLQNKNRTALQKNANVRLNDSKVRIPEIHILCDEIEKWITEFKSFMQGFGMKPDMVLTGRSDN